jgi:hypothetical protein
MTFVAGPPFLAVGPCGASQRAAWQAAGWRVVDGWIAPLEPWSLDGFVFVGRVGDRESTTAAVEVGARGAALAIVEVADEWCDALFDDLLRLGFDAPHAAGGDDADGGTDGDPPWAALLDALATGAPVAQAARQCHLSLRSAYRRLADARAELEVGSTTAAVVAWQRRRRQT